MLRKALVICKISIKNPFQKFAYCTTASFASSPKRVKKTHVYKTPNEDTHAIKNGSTYHPKSLSIISEHVHNKDRLTSEDWNNIRTTLMTNRGFSKENINSIILQHLIQIKQLTHARDFVRSLKNIGVDFNISLLGNVAYLYFLCGEDSLDNEEKLEIVNNYKRVLDKYKVLDIQTYSRFAQGLLVTDHWKESLNILERIQQTGAPSQMVYNNIIVKLFNSGEEDVGWNILKQMSQDNIHPLNSCFISWLNYSLNACKDDNHKLLGNIERMLNFCGENDILMITESLAKYKTVMEEKLGWKGTYVNIYNSGFCKACKSKLQLVDISPEDFHLLQKEFFEKVLIGSNAFTKSTPQEKEEFLRFLDLNAPFDIILDGLNIMYTVPGKMKPELLVDLIGNFVGQNKKVFLLGRKHIRNSMTKSQLRFINQNAFMFLVDDLSYDDIFLLYAALQSDRTQFISRDFMRGHKFLLGDRHIKEIFKKWQKKNQIYVQYNGPNRNISFKPSARYLGIVQKEKGWHIPFHEEHIGILPDTLELPRNWLCLQPPV